MQRVLISTSWAMYFLDLGAACINLNQCYDEFQKGVRSIVLLASFPVIGMWLCFLILVLSLKSDALIGKGKVKVDKSQ